MKLRTISGCPALLSSLGNRRWRRIHFFFFLFCCFSVFYSIWRAFCSRRQIDAKITEQVLHHLEYFISPLVDLCSNSSRTRLPSHHLTANATIEWWCIPQLLVSRQVLLWCVFAHRFFLRLRRRRLSVSFLYSICRWHICFFPFFFYVSRRTHILGPIIISIRQRQVLTTDKYI